MNRASPPNRRRLPCTSSTSSRGGSSETLGVNWHAQAAIGASPSGGRHGKWSATQSMERPVHGDDERRGGRRAPALEDADRKRVALRLDCDAQDGGRSLVRRFAWTE